MTPPPSRVAMLFSAVVLSASLTGSAAAQAGDSTSKARQRAATQPETPACCSIVRIEIPRSMVTARETSTGFTFRFLVRNRRLLDSLTVGEPVWPDFAARTVRVKSNGAQPCCAIVEVPPRSILR